MNNFLKTVYDFLNKKLYYYNFIDRSNFVLGFALIFKGFNAQYHHHKEKEYYYLLFGSGKIIVNGDIFTADPRKTIEIESDQIHAMTPFSNMMLLCYYFKKGPFNKIKYVYHDQFLEI